MPKWKSEATIQRRIVNPMTKTSNDQNKITRQITVNKILHRKLKIEQHENHIKDGDEFKDSGVVSSSCSTNGTQHTE
jgi:hypothetical protein